MTLNDFDSIPHISFEDDTNLPHSLRRTVWLLRDMEDGETLKTADEELDNKPEDIIINMRAGLTAANKSAKPKYVCAHCLEPVGIKVRTNEGDFFPFFSHYKDWNSTCPIRVKNDVDPIRIVQDYEEQFKESSLHQDMINKLEEVLKMCSSFSGVERNKLITTPEIKGYRRPSLYSTYRDQTVCFDALIRNPQIGLLVDRNVFYRMQKLFYIWIFPEFSTQFQRLCQKDILYMNRRNVFVFDSYDYYINHENQKYIDKNINIHGNYKFAYEESIKQKKLMLNCYWQIPEIKNDGRVAIKWDGPKLVSFDELIFDNNSYEVFCHDSDIDFYNSYPEDKQRLIDEWLKIKNDRWAKIFEDIQKRKVLYEQYLARKDRRERLAYYYPLIENGEIVPEPFQDAQTKLWGYKVNDLEVILPEYYEVEPFYLGYAWVRKKLYWGMIDYKDNRICNFEYKSVKKLSNKGLYSVNKAKETYLINYKGKIIYSYKEISDFKNGRAKVSLDGKLYGVIDEYGDIIIKCEFDKINDFINGRAVAMKNGILGVIDEFGKEIYETSKLKNGIIKYKSKFEDKCGLMSPDGEKISELEFNAIYEIEDGKVKVRKLELSQYEHRYRYRYGVIDASGNIIIPLEYDEILGFIDGIARARKNGKWGEIDKYGRTTIPLEYDEIGEFIDGIARARKNGKWGEIDKYGRTTIPLEYDEIGKFIDGIARAKKNDKWGVIDACGNTILPFEYDDDNDWHINVKFELDEIGEFKDGRARAKKNGKWGVINDFGKTIIPFEYDKIGEFVNGRAEAVLLGKPGEINESGIFVQRIELKIKGKINLPDEKMNSNKVEEKTKKESSASSSSTDIYHPDEKIIQFEEELDTIIESIFKETSKDLDSVMEGNAQILHPLKSGYIIKLDSGEEMFMPKKSYKGSTSKEGTRILCGKFANNERGRICLDAQECLSMNELKYRLFSYIDKRDMMKAASVAWAIYKDASESNQEKMRSCIHSLRNYIRKIS